MVVCVCVCVCVCVLVGRSGLRARLGSCSPTAYNGGSLVGLWLARARWCVIRRADLPRDFKRGAGVFTHGLGTGHPAEEEVESGGVAALGELPGIVEAVGHILSACIDLL